MAKSSTTPINIVAQGFVFCFLAAVFIKIGLYLVVPIGIIYALKAVA
jgi:hypothetical protein